MPIIVGRSGIQGDIFFELARIEQLAVDLEIIARGDMPSEEKLSSAPILQNWQEAIRPVRCLIGVCGDHPRLNGPLIKTTDTWVMAPDLGWARTLSRFYRLGEPFSAGNKR